MTMQRAVISGPRVGSGGSAMLNSSLKNTTDVGDKGESVGN